MQGAPPVEPAPRPALNFKGVSKAFAGVQALKAVDFDVMEGEVHALLGENGAGKSTLMKILFGVVQPDGGSIEIAGAPRARISGPREALASGIGLVSQELSLVPQLDVAQNIFLGQKPALSRLKRGELRRRAADILKPLAPDIVVSAPVASLGMAERQIVEIARTLARGGRIIAFDEPTSSLTPSERDGLFRLIDGLKRAGKAIVYISHRMPEIYAVSDRITVLRDGRVVGSGPTASFEPGELNDLIAGRQLAKTLHQPHERRSLANAPVALRVEGLSTAKLRNVSLDLRRGEILGLAGLVGSGRTELVRAIFGADERTGGEIVVNGETLGAGKPAAAIKAGVALIPEDRRGQSIVPLMDIERNFGLASYDRFSRNGLVRGRARRDAARKLVDDLSVRPARLGIPIRNLSGGNQQKVVIARWLGSGAKILLFDEPTRGIDVGAKAEIHALLRRLADDGSALIVISSELPELLMLADTIAVMRDGAIVARMENGAGLTEDRLVRIASGEEAGHG